MSVDTVNPRRLLRGASQRVQGIASSIDDVRLQGREWRVNVTDALVADAMLERSMEGASTLTLPIHDSEGKLRRSKLLQSRFDVELDGLWFRFVGAERRGDTFTLTFEDLEVARLRRRTGAKKVTRGKTTRAEFALMLVREVKHPRIPFFSPELHTRQPIAKAAEGRENARDKDQRRDFGLDLGAKITVKRVKADGEQIRTIDRVLDVGMSDGAPRPVLIAAVMTITQEATARNIAGGDAPGFAGAFQQNDSWPGDSRDLENAAHNFFRRAPTYPGGAIAFAKKNPGAPLAEMCQAIQASADGSLYAAWENEATKTVDEYLGGEGSTATQTVSQRYQFERKPKENSWDCLGRLAEEVRWRRFASAGIVYFIAETDLLRSRVRMRVSVDAPGVDSIDWEYDLGKKIDEVTVTARARAWAAPPGTVAVVEDEGPADGRYVVSTIRSNLFREGVEITLKRPQKPLPEPAPETAQKSIRVPEGAAGGGEAFDAMVAEMERIDGLHLTYVFGGGHSTPAPRNGPFDCSSAVSRILQVGGHKNPTMATGALASWGEAGPGKLVTFFVRNGGPGGGHTLLAVKTGKGWRYWGTSGENPGGGPGWISTPDAGYLAGFAKRHPKAM